jgi:hypothetical protein
MDECGDAAERAKSGDMKASKELHAEALNSQVNVLGAMHTHTLWTISTLERLGQSTRLKKHDEWCEVKGQTPNTAT